MHLKQHLPIMPALLKLRGVEQVVISPGSRNAPLIALFYEVFSEKCIGLVDERSAAYFAMGLAIRSQKTVVLLCTSGTAALNYAPALTEAFHLGVPLIAITADRPAEWIDQQDNQTIQQRNLYSENCKKSFELPLNATSNDDLWFTNRIVNQAYNCSIEAKPGPVHINVPLREPLYESIPATDFIKAIDTVTPIGVEIPENVLQKWNSAHRILILCGQMPPDAELNDILNKLSNDTRVVVLAEAISNCKGSRIISNPDLVLAVAGTSLEEIKPDLVIYLGGQIVSKRLKIFLRNLKQCELWHIDAAGQHVDTYKQLSSVIAVQPKYFLSCILKNNAVNSNSDYSALWNNIYSQTKRKINTLLADVPYSDLFVFDKISKLLSKNDIVFVGNSSVIRYFQFFDSQSEAIYANRGTSGIDGCLSTATGIAHNSEQDVYALLGDLSFVYDSNALWNKRLPSNLKIIVINNFGGGIFSLLEGPSEQTYFSEYQLAYHPVNISKLCEAFSVKHILCNYAETLQDMLNDLKNAKQATLLEIQTPKELNTGIFRNFIKNISNLS